MNLASIPVRWSHLRSIMESPKHYRDAVQRGVRDTTQMRLGRVVDALLFNGPKPVVYPGKKRIGSEWEIFKDEHAGREIVTDDEMTKALQIADAVIDKEHAMSVLSGRRHLELNYEFLGRQCQSHPDVVGEHGFYVTDLKTSMTANPNVFPHHARKMGYLGQLAMYGEAVRASGLGDPQNFYIVAAQNKPPFAVTVFHLTERAVEEGQKLLRSAMERLLACEAANEWPDYAQDVVELDVPDDDPELIFEEEE